MATDACSSVISPVIFTMYIGGSIIWVADQKRQIKK